MINKYVRETVGASPPNTHASLTCGRVKSIDISPVELSGAQAEHTPIDGDGEADLSIDWHTGLANVAPGEGDSLDRSYLATPEGNPLRDRTTNEIKGNYREARKAKKYDINGLCDLGSFKRWRRSRSHVIMDAGWIITWKMIERDVGVKCRLTLRCFKDRFQDLDTYAGTIGRSGQRSVNAVAAGNGDFILIGLDVSQAFAKGLAFEGSSQVTGTECREVKFGVLTADLGYLRQINGFRGV